SGRKEGADRLGGGGFLERRTHLLQRRLGAGIVWPAEQDVVAHFRASEYACVVVFITPAPRGQRGRRRRLHDGLAMGTMHLAPEVLDLNGHHAPATATLDLNCF